MEFLPLLTLHAVNACSPCVSLHSSPLTMHKPCASSQAEVGRAEAASAAASGGLSGLSVGSDMLTPLINRAKQQLEVERAKGGLHKAMAAARTNADLPQLDAAIQAAHKAGLQERAIQASRCHTSTVPVAAESVLSQLGG